MVLFFEEALEGRAKFGGEKFHVFCRRMSYRKTSDFAFKVDLGDGIEHFEIFGLDKLLQKQRALTLENFPEQIILTPFFQRLAGINGVLMEGK